MYIGRDAIAPLFCDGGEREISWNRHHIILNRERRERGGRTSLFKHARPRDKKMCKLPPRGRNETLKGLLRWILHAHTYNNRERGPERFAFENKLLLLYIASSSPALGDSGYGVFVVEKTFNRPPVGGGISWNLPRRRKSCRFLSSARKAVAGCYLYSVGEGGKVFEGLSDKLSSSASLSLSDDYTI